MYPIKTLITIILSVFTLNSLHAQNLIEPGDTLTINLKNVPVADANKFNGQVLVGQKGTLRLAILNRDIKAAGLSPEQVARAIEKAFVDGEIYTNPTAEVFANKAQLAPKELLIHVGGEVAKEGPIQFRDGMTIQQAIMAAGGFSTFGSKERIYLTRKRKQWKLDLRKSQNRLFPVKPGDTIEVDKKGLFEP